MGRRRRKRNFLCALASNSKVSKENINPPSQEGKLLHERIGQLPSEIIVDILSKLKLKEAGSTSILSKGWRYMWTTVYNLDFDGSEVLDDMMRKNKCLKEEQLIYVDCVNQVTRRYQGQTIDQFAIVFTFDDSSRSDIDSWVSFAVRKRVQRLKLDLRNRRSFLFNHYNFPNSEEISSWSSLTCLHLDAVNISGEMLQLLLCNCLNLEGVFVSGSKTLLSLDINGCPSLKLKWLELRSCINIKLLNVSAPNLVSFKYFGLELPMMPLKDVPNLLEISIKGYYGYYLNSHLPELSTYISQLEKLTLGACVFEKNAEHVRFPVFPNLKHLTLTVGTIGFKCLVDYASLINACPSLYYFSFQSLTNNRCSAREAFRAELASHNMIRVVEFNGFCGNALEVEMAEYMIEKAVMLEKIVFIVIHPEFVVLCPGSAEPKQGQISARKCARELGKRLRPSVELVVV